MQTDQKTDFSPGPELDKLISDQVDQLMRKHQQVGAVYVKLWVEGISEVSGIREKFCKMSVLLTNGDFCVTKCGSTYTLAILDAIRTVQKRIIRISARNDL